MWRVLIPLAACVAIIVGALVYNALRVEDTPVMARAGLTDVKGSVTIQRGGETTQAQPEMEVWLGDSVKSGPDSRARFAYMKDATSVDLSASTDVVLLEEAGATRLKVNSGTAASSSLNHSSPGTVDAAW